MRKSRIMLDDCILRNAEMIERHRRPAEQQDQALKNCWFSNFWKAVEILYKYRSASHIVALETASTDCICVTHLNSNPSGLEDKNWEIMDKRRNRDAHQRMLFSTYSILSLRFFVRS